MSDPYYRLAPFIQEYIYSHGWTDLRPVQTEACRVIFETDAHLLIAAGTAAGKTEAAFLPVLTLLHESPPKSIGAMYIGPLKALINDQFDRLDDLLREADIPVCPWHGDITQSRKQKLFKNPRGILQITPESLESLLINKSNDLERLFGDLRFVVIDEIHAFIGSERGSQILCQLARLAKLTGNYARRIGLSATLGDYSLAEDWLRAGTSNPVITPEIESAQRTVHLSLEHFYRSDKIVVRAKGDSSAPEFSPRDRDLFEYTQARKCLIFANNRTEAESAIAALRQIAAAQGLPDIYHVHHGSISAHLREATEQIMREPGPAVTAATVTFEMGIDIGQLERVVQLESPSSVASFLQRLGRSGRRGGPADMRFICEEKPLAEQWAEGDAPLSEQIPWQLLQCIAIIQLYLEERWIEPIQPLQYPFSLLYHQTMSTLAAIGELSPAALAQQILTLPTFRNVSPDDFRLLLRHLISLDHIQQTDHQRLILGLAGERIVRNFQFYATFSVNEEYMVRDGSTDIGSIATPPQIGDRFSLAGRTWETLEVDTQSKVIVAKPATGTASVFWRGGSGNIHTRVLERMRQVLLEDKVYPYLQAGARERLKTARQLARNQGLSNNYLFPIEGTVYCILPWLGTAAFRTLERWLNQQGREAIGLKRVSSVSPYFFTVDLGKSKPEHLRYEISAIADGNLTAEDLIGEDETPKLQKYDEFIPPELLRKAFAHDYLNVTELSDRTRHW